MWAYCDCGAIVQSRKHGVLVHASCMGCNRSAALVAGNMWTMRKHVAFEVWRIEQLKYVAPRDAIYLRERASHVGREIGQVVGSMMQKYDELHKVRS